MDNFDSLVQAELELIIVRYEKGEISGSKAWDDILHHSGVDIHDGDTDVDQYEISVMRR